LKDARTNAVRTKDTYEKAMQATAQAYEQFKKAEKDDINQPDNKKLKEATKKVICNYYFFYYYYFSSFCFIVSLFQQLTCFYWKNQAHASFISLKEKAVSSDQAYQTAVKKANDEIESFKSEKMPSVLEVSYEKKEEHVVSCNIKTNKKKNITNK
jgi:hypothetical protein